MMETILLPINVMKGEKNCKINRLVQDSKHTTRCARNLKYLQGKIYFKLNK